ncbi:pentatricopeptide repeat domain-containing protein 3, mitochondrial isoform X2 [Grammomys surdaster]|uniref:pentatricopeptide repeat domain-containing protein 3, mitochondrial isoform X2 n=1 Tax=Grammomys surdaster TaxID=491861 RepID=UPI0010A02155|nr:pentatricopeptide repeat domain-containing protein 3, mitochondrial isoform X2 [Grammomys surdaster]
MAAAAATRRLPFRSGLVLLQTIRGAGVCEPKFCCRFYPASESLPKVEGTDITGIEEIVIPKKKTWEKVAVLQALASTVNRDPTAVPYVFQDDPFLIPTSTMESRSFLLAKKSGETAAKFIINSHPKYFQKDIAEPHIPCLMPEYFEPQIEDVSEAALKERIKLKKVKASVDIFDQLLQAGTTVSLETTNSLLDLLCYYGDQEPPADYPFQQTEHLENLEEATEENNQTSEMESGPWKAQNNAERIFALMPEKNAHSYCTMIRGMVKHRAYAQALNLYTELLNNRLSADVYTFNALIEAKTFILSEKFEEKWNDILDLLKHMVAQKVKPNLQTFNTILKYLPKFHSLAKLPAMQILREMKHIGIDKFFQLAMIVCSSLRDLELAYQVHGLLNTGDNRKLIGHDIQRKIYYSKFFSLICSLEQIDVTLKWYKDLIPSVFLPNFQIFIGLLQALDVANRLEMVPQIWKDCKEYGHTFQDALRKEVLMLMARDKHSPELQVAFADCAADIKSTYENQDARQTALDWPDNPLQYIAVLFLRGGRTQEAWKMLALFKKHNKIPRNELLEEFMDTAKASSSTALAIEVVKLASAFSLPVSESLAQRVMMDFTVDPEQREALGNLTVLNSSDGESSSDSDINEDK